MAGISDGKDCNNKKFQDSLIARFVDSGAAKLPYFYNNPSWDKYLDSLLAICPQVASAYQLKAVPAIKNGEYTKAYELDERAVKLDPQQFVPYLGFLKCIFTKDYNGAIKDFDVANRIIPGGAEMDHGFYFYLGICYLQLGNYKEAGRNFNIDISSQRATSKTSEVHFNSLLYMALTEMGEDRFDSAIHYFNECLHIYKELPEANYYLALIYKNKKQYYLTRKYLEIAKQSVLDGYTMNEDNLFYVNYPRQVTLFEIDEQLGLLSK